jgi:hypothetical protein
VYRHILTPITCLWKKWHNYSNTLVGTTIGGLVGGGGGGNMDPSLYTSCFSITALSNSRGPKHKVCRHHIWPTLFRQFHQTANM